MKISREIPCLRAASNTVRVPSKSVEKISSWSLKGRAAAACTTTSTSLRQRATVPGLRTSPRTTSTTGRYGYSNGAISSTRTEYPRPSRYRHKLMPRKPAPPVTRTRDLPAFCSAMDCASGYDEQRRPEQPSNSRNTGDALGPTHLRVSLSNSSDVHDVHLQEPSMGTMACMVYRRYAHSQRLDRGFYV